MGDGLIILLSVYLTGLAIAPMLIYDYSRIDRTSPEHTRHVIATFMLSTVWPALLALTLVNFFVQGCRTIDEWARWELDQRRERKLKPEPTTPALDYRDHPPVCGECGRVK